MARRSDHTKEELKHLMISAAKQIIAEHGLSQLSARQLASKLGYTAGTIYNIFDNLNEIILHIEAEVLADLEKEFLSLQGDLSPVQQLNNFVNCYMKFISENLHLWHLLCERHTDNEVSLPDWYTDKLYRLILILENMMRPLFSGEDEHKCQIAARTFWASIHGIVTMSGYGKMSVISPNLTQEFIDYFVTTYVSGLMKTSNF